jgi:hypothetical protein
MCGHLHPVNSHTEPGRSIFDLIGASGIPFAKIIAQSSPRLIISTALIAIVVYVLIISLITVDGPLSFVPTSSTPISHTATPPATLQTPPKASIPTSIEIGYVEPTQITVIVRGGGDLDDLLLTSALVDTPINVLRDAIAVIDNDPFCVIYLVRGGQPREPLDCAGRSAVIDVSQEDMFWYHPDSTRQDITLTVDNEEAGVCTLDERQRCKIQVD